MVWDGVCSIRCETLSSVLLAEVLRLEQSLGIVPACGIGIGVATTVKGSMLGAVAVKGSMLGAQQFYFSFIFVFIRIGPWPLLAGACLVSCLGGNLQS